MIAYKTRPETPRIQTGAKGEQELVQESADHGGAAPPFPRKGPARRQGLAALAASAESAGAATVQGCRPPRRQENTNRSIRGRAHRARTDERQSGGKNERRARESVTQRQRGALMIAVTCGNDSPGSAFPAGTPRTVPPARGARTDPIDRSPSRSRGAALGGRGSPP